MKLSLFFFCPLVLFTVFISTFAQAKENQELLAIAHNSTIQMTEQSDTSLKGQALPDYEIQIIEKRPKRLIGIYCTLSAPIDKDLLEQVGKDCFEKVHGESYSEVWINWYIEGTEKRRKPWGVTNYKKGVPEIAIFSEK